MTKKKLLILQPMLADYRVETFNYLVERFDLDVAYTSTDKTKAPVIFNKIKLESKKIGPFIYIPGLKQMINKYDAVVMMADLHFPQYCMLPFNRRKYKVISWGIGFRVSYTKPYQTNRRHGLLDYLTYSILSKCDANIFYMEKAKEFWKETKLDLNKCFVAPNTTTVAKVGFLPEKKNNFLFVGTLYKGKGLDLLLNTYKQLVETEDIDNKLVIVGDGAEMGNMEAFVNENNLRGKVVFKGAIYDEQVLAKEFQAALLCISPTQGGLSCPKSMGYGVPFIVRKDAITGGEIYHISTGENGIMYEKDKDLLYIMKDAVHNPQRFVKMGELAKDYYDNYATPYHMAKGAINAIEYALQSK